MCVTLTLVSERMQVQLLPALEGLSTLRAGEWVAGVEESRSKTNAKL